MKDYFENSTTQATNWDEHELVSILFICQSLIQLFCRGLTEKKRQTLKFDYWETVCCIHISNAFYTVLWIIFLSMNLTQVNMTCVTKDVERFNQVDYMTL